MLPRAGYLPFNLSDEEGNIWARTINQNQLSENTKMDSTGCLKSVKSHNKITRTQSMKIKLKLTSGPPPSNTKNKKMVKATHGFQVSEQISCIP